MNGKVHQLDPLKWDEYVATSWPELPTTFRYRPTCSDSSPKSGGVFFGPFCGWESEAGTRRCLAFWLFRLSQRACCRL